MGVVGFIGDYPAASETIVTIRHVRRAPCTLWTFRRTHEVDTTGSRYGYTTESNANNATLLRHGKRHDSLRASNVTDSDENRLGMVQNWNVSERQARLDAPDAQKRSITKYSESVPAGTLSEYFVIEWQRNSADIRRVACCAWYV